MSNREFDTPAGSGGRERKLWATPRIILGTMRDAEAKGTPAAATPESHFLTNDYGRPS